MQYVLLGYKWIRTSVTELKNQTKYTECYTPQLQQGLFLDRCAVALGPDSYMSNISLVPAPHIEQGHTLDG